MAEDKLQECKPVVDIEEVSMNYDEGGLLTETKSRSIMNFCSPCNTHYDDITEFDYHVAKVHSFNKSHKAKTMKIHQCSMCQSIFRRQDHLKRHIRSVHSVKHYTKCPVCSGEYSEKEVLSKHIEDTHGGKNEAYKCRECDYQCNSLKTLLIHELDHMDRHVCPHCPMTYKRRDHMIRHVKIEHMKIVFPCQVCDQTYKRKDHLLRHMREKHKQLVNTE